MTKGFVTVAIDGGAASGKSSTAHVLAERGHFLYVCTGNHYRALTHVCQAHNLAPETEEALKSFLGALRLGIKVEDYVAELTLNGECFDEAILKSHEVNVAVSKYAALPMIRQKLLNYQRSLVDEAKKLGFAGIVMEGRDIGSQILPDADFKYFLEADLKARAERRRLEGADDSIGERDRLDSSRQSAPMMCPDRAVRIDSTHMTLQEVVDYIERSMRACVA